MSKRDGRTEKREPAEKEALADIAYDVGWRAATSGAPPRAKELSFEQALEEARLAYLAGVPWALMDTIRHCADAGRQPPLWVRDALWRAYILGLAGELESWDQIFGKPYQEFKSRKHLHRHLTGSRAVRLMRDRKKDPASFEALAAELRIGKPRRDEAGSTGGSKVRDLYYAEMRRIKRRKDPSEKPPSRRKPS